LDVNLKTFIQDIRKSFEKLAFYVLVENTAIYISDSGSGMHTAASTRTYLYSAK
jgi:hypothetical protein